MATIVKAGEYNATNLASVAYHFGRKGEDAPVLALLEQGGDVNAVSHRSGDTALTAGIGASTPGNREAVELLLAHGAEANARSRSGWTALMAPSLLGDTEAVKILLQHGADPNVFTDAEVMERGEGCSTTNALMMAVGNGLIRSALSSASRSA